MENNAERLSYLVYRHLAGTFTDAEREELNAWRSVSAENERLFQEWVLPGNLLEGLRKATEVAASRERVLERLHREMAPPAPEIRMLRTAPWRKWAGYAAAAAILGFAIMFFWQRAEVRPKSPLVQTQAPADIAPGGTGAVLTLADGSKVELDSLGNGVVASQGGTRAVLQNGRLRYEGDEPSGPISYNTISTPRGRQFQLRLPDGTQVWLNAASSLTFPTSFSDTARNVSITGEAYFEVAHNTEAPFLVNIRPGHTVKVLGTKFNINAYPDEPAISTTLLEGAVEAAAGAEKTILRPGFQATMDNNGLSVTAADIASAVAWKNGLFIFQKTDIRTVMRQICRWYDVEVTFEGKTAEKRLTGEVYRNYTLQQALAVLQEADLHFRVDGRRVTVLQ